LTTPWYYNEMAALPPHSGSISGVTTQIASELSQMKLTFLVFFVVALFPPLFLVVEREIFVVRSGNSVSPRRPKHVLIAAIVRYRPSEAPALRAADQHHRRRGEDQRGRRAHADWLASVEGARGRFPYPNHFPLT